MRSSRLSRLPHFIDYNPDLPPAVFPTLDEPRPACNLQMQMKTQCTSEAMVTQKSDIMAQQEGIHVRFKGVEVRDSVQDVPIDEIENFLASNGPQNLTYASNMAAIAGFKVVRSSDENMGGSGYDSEVNHYIP
jgi:hypothetical protein